MNSFIERTLGTWLTKFGKSGMANSEARGYIGFIGSLVTLASLWMSFIDDWFANMSYLDLLSEKDLLFPVVIVTVLVAALCLYASRLHSLGFIIAVIYTITSIIFLFQCFDGIPVREVFAMAGTGLYAMGIGLLLMILSPFLWKVNEKIETLFHSQNAKENG